MPLPSQEVLSATILQFVNSQKEIKSTDSPEKQFSDGLAKIILETIKSASVIGVKSEGTAGPYPAIVSQVGVGSLE